MNTCIECAQEKPWSEFYAHKQMSSGYLNICKECHKGRMKVRARMNPSVQEYDRERAKLPHRKEMHARNCKRWREENPLGYQAHTAVSNAVRTGRLKRLPCEFCGDERVHAHHKDYSKPLDVIWLCAKCHNRLHANFPELEGKMKGAA